jgi:hypothetical protein
LLPPFLAPALLGGLFIFITFGVLMISFGALMINFGALMISFGALMIGFGALMIGPTIVYTSSVCACLSAQQALVGSKL